jgi:iron complex outermembrane recepter protein
MPGMNNSMGWSTLQTSLALTILMTASALATAAEESPLAEIVVTATRRAQPLQDVPASVAVVDPDQFAQGGLNSLADVLAYVPGVIFNDNGAPGQGSVTMRGVTNIFSTASVGIYIDDIPYGSETSFAEGANFALDALLADIDRVEVIKGPQGTLYGASSMGGALRYITREPSLTEVHGKVSSDLSETAHGGFNQLYKGSVSVPLIHDKLALSVSGFYQNADGFIDETSRNLKDVNGAKLQGGSAALLFEPTDKLKIKLNYMNQKFDFRNANAVPFDVTTGTPTAGRYNEVAPTDTPTAIKFELAGATLEYQLGWATATAVTSYQKFSQKALDDLTQAFGPFVDNAVGDPPGTNSVLLNFDITTERIADEVRLTSASNGKLEWITGLYFTRESSSNFQGTIVSPATFNLVQQIFPSGYKEYAGFGDVTYYITPQFDTTLGLRLSHNEASVSFSGTGVFAGPDIDQRTVTDNVKTYLFNARYRPTKDLSLYARIASGYRPASANLALIDPNTGQQLSEPFIKADSLWSYEVGAKGAVADGVFGYDAAVYHINWKDLQVFRSFMGVNVGGNADSNVLINGVETTFTLRPAKALTLIASASYSSSELAHDDASIGALEGEQLPGIPKWTFSFTGNYEVPLTDQLKGFLAGGVNYKGETKTSFFGGTAANGTALVPSSPNYTIPHYTTADLRLGVNIMDRFQVSLYATNLFNQYGYQSATTAAFGGTATILRPRTVGAVLAASF